MTVPKTPTRITMYLSLEEQRIITELREEQHAKLIASGALLGPPTMPDIVRSLIAREGARLASGKVTAAEGLSMIVEARESLKIPRTEEHHFAPPLSPSPFSSVCAAGPDGHPWPVAVPIDALGYLAIVNDDTRAIFKEANSDRNALMVAYYYRALKDGERFIHPLNLPNDERVMP